MYVLLAEPQAQLIMASTPSRGHPGAIPGRAVASTRTHQSKDTNMQDWYWLDQDERTINRYIIHALSEGKTHTATVDHYNRSDALHCFYTSTPFMDSVIQSVEELGPIS